MTGTTLGLAKSVLTATCTVTASAAFLAIVVLIIRHALSSGGGIAETDQALDRAKRIVGFVLVIALISGGGGVALSNAVVDGVVMDAVMKAEGTAEDGSLFLPAEWTGSKGLVKVTTSGEAIRYELPDSFVDDGSPTAKAVLLAKDSLDAAGGTQDRQESREALNKALEEYYRAHGQIAND